MRSLYHTGLDFLSGVSVDSDFNVVSGAPFVAVDSDFGVVSGVSAERAVVIRVNDVAALVAKKGGATGKTAYALVPETITTKVYDTIASNIRDAMKEKGVNATVDVRDASGMPVVPGGYPLLRNVGIGVGAFTAGLILGRLVLGGRSVKGRLVKGSR